MNLKKISGSLGGIVLYGEQIVFCSSGKNGHRKCESFMLFAKYGRTIETKRVGCAVGMMLKDVERAIDIFRDRNKDGEQ